MKLELKCPKCGDLPPDGILVYQTGGRGYRNLKEILDENGFFCDKHQINLEVKVEDLKKIKSFQELIDEQSKQIDNKIMQLRDDLAEFLVSKGL